MFLGVLEREKISLQDTYVPYCVKLKTAPARLIFPKIDFFQPCTFQPVSYRPQITLYFFKKNIILNIQC